MRVNLNVPYADKNEARLLGASWDGARKTWYVEGVENLQPFLQWMPEKFVKPTSSKPLAKKKAKPASYPMWGAGYELLYSSFKDKAVEVVKRYPAMSPDQVVARIMLCVPDGAPSGIARTQAEKAVERVFYVRRTSGVAV